MLSAVCWSLPLDAGKSPSVKSSWKWKRSVVELIVPLLALAVPLIWCLIVILCAVLISYTGKADFVIFLLLLLLLLVFCHHCVVCVDSQNQ